MHKAPPKTLFTSSAIRKRIAELAGAIAEEFQENELAVIGLLKGGFIFLADLVRELHKHHLSLTMDLIYVSSYGSATQSSGIVDIQKEGHMDIQNQDVLLVDDILDSGRTLNQVSETLLTYKPSRLRTCVFLDKPSRRAVPFQADFVGFTIPDTYVVGYGLDWDNRYRELPYISQLDDVDSEMIKKSGKTV